MSFLNLKTWLTLFISSSVAFFYIVVASTYMHRESDNIGMIVVPVAGGFFVMLALGLIDFKNIVSTFSFHRSSVRQLLAVLGSALYAVLGVFLTLLFIIVYLFPYDFLKEGGMEYATITRVLLLLFFVQVGVQSYLVFRKMLHAHPESFLNPIPQHSFLTEFLGLKKFFIAALIVSLLFSLLFYDASYQIGKGVDPLSFYLSTVVQGSFLIYVPSILGLIVKFFYQKYKKIEQRITWVTLGVYVLARVVYLVVPSLVLRFHTALMQMV